jgi:glycosyltransferase involved in cell wall biosynthesis
MTAPLHVSIVIPALDEEAAVGDVVREAAAAMAAARLSYEILVVDDGSADGTGPAAAAAGARVLRHPEPRGYGASLLAGIREARSERIVILDADATYPAGDIPQLVEAARAEGAAVGIRTLRENAAKRLLRGAFRGLVRAVAGRPVGDVNSGFRSFPRRFALEHAALFPSGFSFTTTLTLLTSWADLPVAAIAIEYRPRKGRSKVRLLRDGARAVATVLRLTARRRPGRLLLLALASAGAATALAYGVLAASGMR